MERLTRHTAFAFCSLSSVQSESQRILPNKDKKKSILYCSGDLWAELNFGWCFSCDKVTVCAVRLDLRTATTQLIMHVMSIRSFFVLYFMIVASLVVAGRRSPPGRISEMIFFRLQRRHRIVMLTRSLLFDRKCEWIVIHEPTTETVALIVGFYFFFWQTEVSGMWLFVFVLCLVTSRLAS